MDGNIRIIEPADNFQRVSKSIIFNENVDPLTLGIYVKILALGKKWQLNVNGLSSLFSISTDKVRKSLAKLEDEGYLERKRNQDASGHFVGWEYLVSSIPFTDIAKTPTSVETERREIPTSGKMGGIYRDKKEKIENKSKTKTEFIPPTPQEVLEYAKERGFVDPSGFAAHFCEYYTISSWHLSNGRPMKDWKKAVITWEPNNKYRNFGKPSPRSAAPPSRTASPDHYDFTKDW